MLYISKAFRQNWGELEDGLFDICKVSPNNIATGFLRKVILSDFAISNFGSLIVDLRFGEF